MLRILHTSDWHLGQRLFGWDRIQEQRHALAELVAVIANEKVDVLLVCGDVFDVVNPSAEAEALYYQFLASVKQEHPSLQIVITSGNHDSPYRLKAPSPLLEALGVNVVSTVSRTSDGTPDYKQLIIPLYKEKKRIATCLATPFLRRGDLPTAREDDAHVRFFREAFKEAKLDGYPVIIMAHLYLSGATARSEKESNRPLVLGDSEVLEADQLPQEACYIALGHIHRAQKLDPQGTIRYSGSLLPMSFTERDYQHGAWLVELDQEGNVETKFCPIKPLAPLNRIRGNEAELKEYLKGIPEGDTDSTTPFLNLVLVSDHPRPDLLEEFRTVVVGKKIRLTQISLERETHTTYVAEEPIWETLENLAPLDVAKQIYAEQNEGASMPDELIKLFNLAVEKSLEQ